MNLERERRHVAQEHRYRLPKCHTPLIRSHQTYKLNETYRIIINLIPRMSLLKIRSLTLVIDCAGLYLTRAILARVDLT